MLSDFPDNNVKFRNEIATIKFDLQVSLFSARSYSSTSAVNVDLLDMQLVAEKEKNSSFHFLRTLYAVHCSRSVKSRRKTDCLPPLVNIHSLIDKVHPEMYDFIVNFSTYFSILQYQR